jgi:hypothetical protein
MRAASAQIPNHEHPPEFKAGSEAPDGSRRLRRFALTVVVQSRRPNAYPFALFRNDEPADVCKLNVVDVREALRIEV